MKLDATAYFQFQATPKIFEILATQKDVPHSVHWP